MFILSIVWLFLTQLFSLFPCFVIYQSISKKPILAVKLVDLVYRDIIIYNHLICFVSSTPIIHCLCLNNETLTLSYTFAMAYSTLVNFFISCFSISLIIRLPRTQANISHQEIRSCWVAAFRTRLHCLKQDKTNFSCLFNYFSMLDDFIL
jgi:hypothetical protein